MTLCMDNLKLDDSEHGRVFNSEANVINLFFCNLRAKLERLLK